MPSKLPVRPGYSGNAQQLDAGLHVAREYAKVWRACRRCAGASSETAYSVASDESGTRSFFALRLPWLVDWFVVLAPRRWKRSWAVTMGGEPPASVVSQPPVRAVRCRDQGGRHGGGSFRLGGGSGGSFPIAGAFRSARGSVARSRLRVRSRSARGSAARSRLRVRSRSARGSAARFRLAVFGGAAGAAGAPVGGTSGAAGFGAIGGAAGAGGGLSELCSVLGQRQLCRVSVQHLRRVDSILLRRSGLYRHLRPAPSKPLQRSLLLCALHVPERDQSIWRSERGARCPK